MVMKNTNDGVFRGRYRLSPRAVVMSVLLFTVISSGAFADNNEGSGRLFDVSLPQVNDSNMQRLGMNLGWSSDLMCGNFDLKTTVGITPDEEPGEEGRWSM